MMAALLLIAFLQITLLPGLLLQELVFSKVRFRYKLINALPLSFICNYVLVVSLFSLGSLNRTAVLIFVFAELMVAIYLFWKNKELILNQKIADSLNCFYGDLEFNPFLLKISIFCGGILIAVFLANIGTIFKNWDAVFSWNRWAMDWYQGIWPIGTAHYPQMYPVNWALSYFIMGYDFQFVPKLVMSLSALVLFFTPIVFFKNFKSVNQSLTFTLLLTGVLYSFLRIYLNDGYVDGPVSIWGFLCFSNLLYSFKEENETEYFYFVSLLLLAFLPLVKQAGWLLYIPFFFYLFKHGHFKKVTKKSIVTVGLFLIFTVGYYAYTEYRIRSGSNHSEVPFVTGGIYGGRAIFERWQAAIGLLTRSVFMGFVVILAVGSYFLSLFKKNDDKIIFGYWTSYFFIWMTFYSYDQRNLVMCIPFVLYYFHKNYFSKIKIHEAFVPIFKKVGTACLLLACLSASTKVKFEGLVELQDQKTILVGNKEVNDYLARYYSDEKNRPFPRIMGDYPMIVNLRWVRPYFLHNNMDKSESVKEFFADSNYHFLAIYDLASAEVRELLQGYEKNGLIIQRVHSKQAILYEKTN